jgi:hypothetical protein
MHQKAKHGQQSGQVHRQSLIRRFKINLVKSSSQEITANIDERPGAAVFADVVDENLGLLV